MRDLPPAGHIPSVAAPTRPRASDALEPGSFAYHAFTQLPLDVQALDRLLAALVRQSAPPGLMAALKASLTGGKPEGEA